MMTNTYLGNAGDHRLQESLNLTGAGATLSKFDYTYDAEGEIQSWTKQALDGNKMWNDFTPSEQLTIGLGGYNLPRPYSSVAPGVGIGISTTIGSIPEPELPRGH